MRKVSPTGVRHRIATPYMSQEMTTIFSEIERETNDPALAQSIYFGPTALTHIRRVIEMGGTIVADTMLIANDIDETLLGRNGARVVSFIKDPQVEELANQRRITRAEVAVDYGLALPGPKLMVIGSAPAAINRIVQRRMHEPMSDVGVLAAATGFASVVQLKERLVDSNLTSIVVRGKKGGAPIATTILNVILREIAKNEK